MINQKNKDYEKEVNKLNDILLNERFVANASELVVAENKQALSEVQNKLEKIENELKVLTK